jgi:hypothetical protein
VCSIPGRRRDALVTVHACAAAADAETREKIWRDVLGYQKRGARPEALIARTAAGRCSDFQQIGVTTG